MSTNKNISEEEERRRRIEQQKRIERNQIDSALSLVDDGLSVVLDKLTSVHNILNEDILLDNKCFKAEEIQNIKNQI